MPEKHLHRKKAITEKETEFFGDTHKRHLPGNITFNPEDIGEFGKTRAQLPVLRGWKEFNDPNGIGHTTTYNGIIWGIYPTSNGLYRVIGTNPRLKTHFFLGKRGNITKINLGAQHESPIAAYQVIKKAIEKMKG
jgi:hypothetical protein